MNKISEFAKHYHTRKFQKGELLLVQGEVPTSVFLIKSGIVKTYNLTADGDEKPITFDLEGDMFPIGWTFNLIHHSQYYYEAYTNCEVYSVPKNDLIAFLKKSPDVLFELCTAQVRSKINYQMRVNALEQSKASNKVINTLHYLCLEFGKELKENNVKVDLPLTQQELANFMGLTRETTGIELKKLQKDGIITYKRQNYIIKTNKLNELLDEDYGMGVAFGPRL